MMMLFRASLCLCLRGDLPRVQCPRFIVQTEFFGEILWLSEFTTH